MNKNGFFKCLNCGHYQHTTEFGECEECSYEDLYEITEEEYNHAATLPKKWINVYEVVNSDSEDSEEWVYEFVKGVLVNEKDMEEEQDKLLKEYNDCENVVVFIEDEKAESQSL